MATAMRFTKLVVGDLDRSGRFYAALGLSAFHRSSSGQNRFSQEQLWVSASGDMGSHVLLLSRFVELPPPDPPAYPGEAWLILGDLDVDAACDAVVANGGAIVREARDTPEFKVRSAVVTDPDGHHIELTGPIG